MVINTEVRFSGVWRSLTDVEVRFSGSWRDIKTVEVRNGGVWRLVFENPDVNLAGEAGILSTDTTTSPWVSTSGIRVNDDGTIDKVTQVNAGSLIFTQIDSATDWIIPNELGDTTYDFQLNSTTSDPNHLSDSIDTWIAMGSGSQSSNYLQWLRQRTIVGLQSWNWDLRVRKDGGAQIDTGNYTGSNENGTL